MKVFITKWALASLVVPLLVLLFQSVGGFDTLAIFYWPGALMLLSLGGPEPRPFSDVVYVWSMAVASNVFLYVALGSFVYMLKKKMGK